MKGRMYLGAVWTAAMMWTGVRTADATELRVVEYRDGPVPRITAQGDRYVHGALDLELRFVHINPLCFAYAVNGRTEAAGTKPARVGNWQVMIATARAAKEFQTVEDALQAIDARASELAALRSEAAKQATLDDVWEACLWTSDPASLFAAQVRRVEQVEALLRARLDPSGAWTRVLFGARQTLAGAQDAADKLDAAGGADAQRRRLVRIATEFERQLAETITLISRLQEELERAQQRLAAAPTSVVLHHGPNERIWVSVTRSRVQRGSIASDVAPLTVTSAAYRTLAPIWLDLGFGPSVTFRNTEAYALAVRDAGGTTALRTEDSLNVDGVVSLSVYVWGARYLDPTVFHTHGLLPRPMVGASVRQPFTSIYLGGQVDPVQFLDLSFGARVYRTERVVTTPDGSPVVTASTDSQLVPVTQSVFTTQMFVALTASTDLFHRWIRDAL